MFSDKQAEYHHKVWAYNCFSVQSPTNDYYLDHLIISNKHLIVVDLAHDNVTMYFKLKLTSSLMRLLYIIQATITVN